MDTITHGIAGALIGKAFFARDDASAGSPSWYRPPVTPGRTAIVAGTLGAIFPDIDVFMPLFSADPLASLMLHRNVTHSLAMLPVWSVLLAWLVRGLARSLHWPAPRFPALVALFGATIGSHVFLDFITSYGTLLWSPLNYDRMAGDWVFIIDLTLTSIVLVPQLAAWSFAREDRSLRRALGSWAVLSALAFAIGPAVRAADIPYPNSAAFGASGVYAGLLLLPLTRRAGSRIGRVKWSRIGVALLVGYLAFTAVMHRLALRQLAAFVSAEQIQAERIAALPAPPSAARWTGLIAAPGGIYRVAFDIFDSSPPQVQYFAQAANDRHIASARRLPGVQTFLWFARFPLFRLIERAGRPVVEISDLQFYGTRRPWERASALEPNVTPRFTYEVVFSADGRILSSGRQSSD